MDPQHNPWNPSDEPVVVDPAGDVVTLVDGTTFCVSARGGDFTGGAHGLFFADLRALSVLRLSVDDSPLQPMVAAVDGSDRATFVLRHVVPSPGEQRLMLVRRRRLLTGMTELIEIRNHGRVDRVSSCALTSTPTSLTSSR